MKENKETSLLNIFKKSEILKSFVLEISIIKNLKQIQKRAFIREKKIKDLIGLGLNSAFLPFIIFSFFVTGPIGVGLNIISSVLYGLSILGRPLINKFSKNGEFIKENEVIFELIEKKMQEQITKNFEYKIPKEKIIV